MSLSKSTDLVDLAVRVVIAAVMLTALVAYYWDRLRNWWNRRRGRL